MTVCVPVCMFMCAYMCVCACMHACVHACVCTLCSEETKPRELVFSGSAVLERRTLSEINEAWIRISFVAVLKSTRLV